MSANVTPVNHAIGESGGRVEGGIWGDVVLDSSVAIAPNVLLFADPPARIEIDPGVCIGAGSIIHAWGGLLRIEAGALLGTATLLVGSGRIGTHACIGAMSTVVNPDIEDGCVVPAGSYFGEDSVFSPHAMGDNASGHDASRSLHPSPPSDYRDRPPYKAGQPDRKPVYGVAAFYRLMAMLFPHRDFSDALPSHSTPPSLDAAPPSSSDRHGDAL